ncbi:MAG: hypothetical protein EON60_07945 [Alphaproteobacteria bacterium]|nr:MAG: hypothetical protein EON60_07945 [Alphaproteobacteria bacterium]
MLRPKSTDQVSDLLLWKQMKDKKGMRAAVNPNRHQTQTPLPQIVDYVNRQLPVIVDAMRRMEAQNDGNHRQLGLGWKIIGKRPKMRNTAQFTIMVEGLLAEALDDAGFAGVYVNGMMRDLSFNIVWQPAAPPETETP